MTPAAGIVLIVSFTAGIAALSGWSPDSLSGSDAAMAPAPSTADNGPHHVAGQYPEQPAPTVVAVAVTGATESSDLNTFLDWHLKARGGYVSSVTELAVLPAPQ